MCNRESSLCRREFSLCRREFCRLSSAQQPSLYFGHISDLCFFPDPSWCWGAQVKLLLWVMPITARAGAAVPWGGEHSVCSCRRIPAREGSREVSATVSCSGITAGPCRYHQIWVCAPQAVLQLLLSSVNIDMEAENPRAGFCLAVLRCHRAGSEDLPLPSLNAALIQL